MPTGYTAPVIDGKITTFKEFAELCATAFCRECRDGGGLPTMIDPRCQHYRRRAEKAKRALEKFCKLPMEVLEKRYKRETAIFKRSIKTALFEVCADNKKINDMIDKVETWVPPTIKHLDLKKFMLDQLEISIQKTDYYTSQLNSLDSESLEKWKSSKIKCYESDIEYNTERWVEYVRNAETEMKWIKELRDSL